LPKDETCVTILHEPARENQAFLLSEELHQLEVPNQVVPVQAARGKEEVVLLVLLAIPLRTFLESFGKSLGESAGSALRGLVRKILKSDGDEEATRCIVIRDSKNGKEFWLSDRLPLKAYEQLLDEDFTIAGSFFYEEDLSTWKAIPRP
jgi:hypothetical protein